MLIVRSQPTPYGHCGRRFADPKILTSIDREFQEFARREMTFSLEAFVEAIPGEQVNPHDVDRLAGNRLIQSARAKSVGLLVPETLVTQIPSRARGFMESHHEVVTKAISYGIVGESGLGAYTSEVDESFSLSGLEICPAMFQDRIAKRRDWRITTVGNRVFAARTRDDATLHRADWRRSSEPVDIFELSTLPRNVENMILDLCVLSGLRFATHDLVETTSGDFYFLETNPAGQWGWLEVGLGMPVGEALATLLVAYCGRADK
jgi:glutathione synthase/RimK-type ligase-like ATP-grasp enzyme